MARMRGVSEFQTLWDRRTTLQSADGARWDVMALPDLVAAKKTQRDKDWPMIRRLIEADYANAGDSPPAERSRFWLREARTPEIILELSERVFLKPRQPQNALADFHSTRQLSTRSNRRFWKKSTAKGRLIATTGDRCGGNWSKCVSTVETLTIPAPRISPT